MCVCVIKAHSIFFRILYLQKHPPIRILHKRKCECEKNKIQYDHLSDFIVFIASILFGDYKVSF